MKVESLSDFQKIISEVCTAYNKHLLADAAECASEELLSYANQRMDQVREFYPVMVEICTAAGKLTPFKE